MQGASVSKSTFDTDAGVSGDRADESQIVDRAIRDRFANRQFIDRPVSRETVAAILEVARFAPSGANLQPWRIYVVAGDTQRKVTAALLTAHDEARDRHSSEYQYYTPELPEPYRSRRDRWGRTYYGSLGIDQKDLEARARRTAKNYTFWGAPVGLIVTIDRRLQVGSWLDLGMFLENVMIVARARGLESCPQETFSKYHLLLRQILPIPPEEMVVCGISLGFPAESERGPVRLMDRLLVEEFAQFFGFEGGSHEAS